MRAPTVTIALSMALGCALGGGGAPREARIADGRLETGHNAVGAVLAGTERICTGTLVHPRAVLSTAGCLAGRAPDTLSFYVGPDASGTTGRRVQVESLHPHPDYSADTGAADLAIIVLVDSPAVAQYAHGADAAAYLDRSVMVVGYGVTDQAQSTEKRTAVLTIDSVQGQTLTFSGVTRAGDEGAPLLRMINDRWTILGIYSHKDATGAAVAVRTDRYSSFIADRLAAVDGASAAAGSGASGTGTGTGTQPDSTSTPITRDFCIEAGYYDDGICDPDCPEPDIDCVECADDGFCNDSCVEDPDCADYCVVDGYCDDLCDFDPDCDYY